MNEFNDQEQPGSGATQPQHGRGPENPGDVQQDDRNGSYWHNPGQQNATPVPPSNGGYQPPYSPPYGGNTYPPNQGGYRGYTPPGQNPVGGYQPPYQQYNANSGWQNQQLPRVQEKYEWKFEDYDKLDGKREKKKKNRGIVVFTVSLICVLAVGLVGLAAYSIMAASSDDFIAGENGADSSRAEDGAAGESELSIVDKPVAMESGTPVAGEKMTIPQVARSVSPSVVGVIMFNNDQRYEIGGLGSGIIMSEEGYIITNAHVVAGGTSFKVELHDGDPYDAELIGYDTITDLAVLKISAEDLVPAQFGNSEDIEVGETVVAIGNPAGMELAGSVTQGIVSAVNREVRTTNYTMNYIQTDAAINPGNSGGALANQYGQVIGINSLKIVAAGYEGIGFAIPIGDAKPIIDSIISTGRVTGRVMLGVTCKSVDEVDARNYGIQQGLSIETIDPASDLANEGVLTGDILTHIDGQRVYNLSDVRKILNGHKAGDTVSLTLYRRLGPKEVTFEVNTRLLESTQ